MNIVHVTHEAVVKIGGIGAVLEGLITAPEYQRRVKRTLLVGPLFSGLDEEQIRRSGRILYAHSSASHGVDADLFRAVEEKYGVSVVYGSRRIVDATSGKKAEIEVVLVDCSSMDPARENDFKHRLHETFGLHSDRYESIWDFEQYLRLAEPAYEVISGLLKSDSAPHIVISHEYMGMPLALRVIMDRNEDFRTVFHAHEVATIRPIVEESPGHDAMFYNVLRLALEESATVDDIFGDQSGFYRHALIGLAFHCDAIFAVGDSVVEELRFLGPAFRSTPIDLVYNGVPSDEISLEQKKESLAGLTSFAHNLVGFEPDFVFTHVTRLVPSKGLWRDFLVLEHLDGFFAADNLRGVFIVLTSSAGTRSADDVQRMENEYRWPADHRTGYPDLEGPEVELWNTVRDFNQNSGCIKAILVNQFGWSRDHCGSGVPGGADFIDLRRGTHLEFGQSIYEPFGIAQLEPLAFGGLCVFTSVCGCTGFVERAAGGDGCDNAIVADYTHLGREWALEPLLRMDAGSLLEIERAQSLKAAETIYRRLPRTDRELDTALNKGFGVAREMGWERVARDLFLPPLERISQRRT